MTRRFWASSSVREAATSKLASIRDAVTFACWPPGPEERLARMLISSSGIATWRLISSTAAIVTDRRCRPRTPGLQPARAANRLREPA
jgi:hypothetical protein